MCGRIIKADSAVAWHRSLFAALAALMFSVVIASASGQDRFGPVRLPVVDKQDIRFTHLTAGKDPLQGRMPGGFAQDKYGFVWIGTYSVLYRYDGYSLKVYQHDPDDANSLSGDGTSVYVDRSGIVWVGTSASGLNRLDPARNTLPSNSVELSNLNTLSDGASRSLQLALCVAKGMSQHDRLNGVL